ncbi:MAG: hypothetical protein WDM78_18915 [Puia sp.]
MSDEEMIPLETFCTYYQVERSFIETLESYGLVSISSREEPTFYINGRSGGTGKIQPIVL